MFHLLVLIFYLRKYISLCLLYHLKTANRISHDILPIPTSYLQNKSVCLNLFNLLIIILSSSFLKPFIFFHFDLYSLCSISPTFRRFDIIVNFALCPLLVKILFKILAVIPTFLNILTNSFLMFILILCFYAGFYSVFIASDIKSLKSSGVAEFTVWCIKDTISFITFWVLY